MDSEQGGRVAPLSLRQLKNNSVPAVLYTEILLNRSSLFFESLASGTRFGGPQAPRRVRSNLAAKVANGWPHANGLLGYFLRGSA